MQKWPLPKIFVFICPSFRRTYYAVRCSGNFFVGSSSKFFYICFGPLGVRICNQKFWCLSFCQFVCLSVCRSVNTLQATVLVQFAWNLAQMCILGVSRNGTKRFSKFQFLPPRGVLKCFFGTPKFQNFHNFGPIYMKFGIRVYL